MTAVHHLGGNTVAEAARAAHAAGLAVMPPRQDGSKRPDGQWKDYQTERPTLEQIERWYGSGTRTGLGLLCGAVSGGLEMLEFEGRAADLVDEFCDKAEAAGIGDALLSILDGYLEHTPAGGLHLLYRCAEVDGNLKLAANPAGEVLIETRGEGGFTIVAPSHGTVHPTGQAWRLVAGGFDTIPTITPNDRAVLHDVARTFGVPVPEPLTLPTPVEEFLAGRATEGPSWMDDTVADFNDRHSWDDVLVGWTRDRTDANGVTYWVRPGKDPRHGHSATTNALGTDTLIVFSSSVAGFDLYTGNGPAPSYDKFGAWAILHHQGDRVAAAREQRPTPTATEPPRPSEDDTEAPERQDVVDFVNTDDPPYDWLVPDLIERGDRIILTGVEGGGKSTLLRQMGMKIGAGLHPFDDFAPELPPVSVLYVDLENSVRQVRRALRPLVELVGDYPRSRFWPECRPQGLDLGRDPDFTWLASLVADVAPDLLVIGPLYKLANGDPTEEIHAKTISTALDFIRTAYAVAMLIEAHSPHGGNDRAGMRPYGASLWMRWPEFGVGLKGKADGPTARQVVHWRGQRDERRWPKVLDRGDAGGWPWVEVNEDKAVRWANTLAVIHSWEGTSAPTVRELSELTGYSKSAVDRQIKANRGAYEAALGRFR